MSGQIFNENQKAFLVHFFGSHALNLAVTDMIKNAFLKIHFWYKLWDIKSYRKSPKRDQMLNKMRNVQLFKISNANENMWTFQNAYQDHLRDSDNLSSNGLSRGEH